MLCFVDESWHGAKKEKIGVLAGVIADEKVFLEYGQDLYKIRHKYYGRDHAKDLSKELKGSKLLSNGSFKHRYNSSYPKNLTIGREMLSEARDRGIKVIGVTVYGNRQPPLLATSLKWLDRPFKELCERVICEIPDGQQGMLVFDQRVGAQEGISIAVHNYLAGMSDEHRLNPFPFVGVSNVFAGLQLADVVAHILGRYATGDTRFNDWYKRVKALQVQCVDHRGFKVYGLMRLDWTGGDRFRVRKVRTKK